MGFTLRRYLSKKFHVSSADLSVAIAKNFISVNGRTPQADQIVDQFDSIIYEDKILQSGIQKIYVAYYKPRGIESTLNNTIPNSLVCVTGLDERLFPLGRLDKESEGLMILTNDGNIYNKITHSQNDKEKEYLVEVNKDLNKETIERLRNGIEIMGQFTKPCLVEMIDKRQFSIVLTQGLNRQIRRMCYKLDYEVTSLKRIRIANLSLLNLNPGEWRYFEADDLLPEL